jgi:hypothetical protein
MTVHGVVPAHKVTREVESTCMTCDKPVQRRTLGGGEKVWEHVVEADERGYGPVTKARQEQCHHLAERHELDGNALFAGAMAAWSNLNPQRVSFDYALSVALSVLLAVQEVQ